MVFPGGKEPGQVGEDYRVRNKPSRQKQNVPPVRPSGRATLVDRAAAFGETRLVYLVASLFVLIPCFWQSRLQAGDLSSHIYNAWLAQLIGRGQAPGLEVAHQATNILFDLMLSAILPIGAGAAQKTAVALAVLIFVWGAFAFASAVSGRRAWGMLPVIAMLSYGWVFHMGFFNYYMSLGMCFCAMALCWDWKPRLCLAAVPVFMLAWLAHALPVVWALSLLAYAWKARRLTPRARFYFLSAWIVAIILARIAVSSRMFTRWFPTQILTATGLDQVRVFDSKYDYILGGLALLWALALFGLPRNMDFRLALAGIPFHLCVLTAFGILVMPTLVLLPGYKHALAYIAERMSLALGICVCASVAGVQRRAYHHYLMTILALVFFGFLFRDENIFNAFEDRMERLVAQLPPGQRVIGAIDASNLHVNALAHMIDRVCLGRCYSYGNYEPTTAQFRIRVVADNPIVVSTYEDAWAMQAGIYAVKERDLPLYEINIEPNGRMVTLSMLAGGSSGVTRWNPL